MMDARKCLDIYEYCQRQWDKLAKKDGSYNPSRHDKLVFEMAAKEFRMSEVNISKAYDLVSRTLAKNSGNGETRDKLEYALRNALSKDLGYEG